MTLASLPIQAGPAEIRQEPYTIEEDIEGNISSYALCVEFYGSPYQCAAGSMPFVPWQNARAVLRHVDADTKTILVEMAWTPDEPLGEHLRLTLSCTGCDSTSVMGTSPLAIRADPNEHQLDDEWQWAVSRGYGSLAPDYSPVGVGAGAAYRQDYTIYVTIFQHEAAPDGYSRLP